MRTFTTAALFYNDGAEGDDQPLRVVAAVDDRVGTGAQLAALLAPLADLETVADGRSALAALEHRARDLLLVDPVLPDMEGVELVRRVRAAPGLGHPAIILVSAQAGPEARAEALAAGADDYLVKPLAARRLGACIIRALARARVPTGAPLTDEMPSASEEQLRLALHSAAMGSYVWYVDEDRWELDAHMRALFGLEASGAQAMADVLQRLIHPADRARYFAAVAHAIDPSGDGEFCEEVRLLVPDGERWLTLMGRTHFDGEPRRPRRLVGVASDITARRRAEAALRESETRQAFVVRLADALRSLSDPVQIQETAARILAEQLGANRVAYRQVSADDETYFDHGGTKDATGKDSAMVRVPLVKAGRVVAALSVQFPTPRRWPKGDITLIEETAERTWDAVERARAEVALRQSEEIRRLALAGGRMGVWRWNMRDRTCGGDAVFLSFYDLPPTDDMLPADAFLHSVAAEDRARMERVMAAGLPAGYSFDVDLCFVAGPRAGRWHRWIGRADEAEPWIVTGVSFDITQRRRAEEERDRLAVAEAVAAERQAVLKRVVRAQEEERARVAHEIHDSVTQLTHAAAMHLDNAVELLDRSSDAVRPEVERARDLARQAAVGARRLIAGLRPETLDLLGLAGALQQEVEVLRAAGWRADLDDEPLAAVRLDAEAEISLYRVAQEALTNVRKHAGPARVRVRLGHREGSVWLEVRDWGRGFDANAARPSAEGEHVGLTSMRERMELLGGKLEIRSAAGRGTTVRAILPDAGHPMR
ncbi:MAG: response regulator [Chloroflexi bacterium]|nr:response regulator [Chloroflexota bacterium]